MTITISGVTISEGHARAILADLCDYILSAASDATIADDHRVPVSVVRTLRREMYAGRWASEAMRLRVAGRLRRLRALTGWDGTTDDLLIEVLDAAITRATRRKETRDAA